MTAGDQGRVRATLAEHVGRGSVPGIVTAVSRRGETRIETLGVTAFGGDQPMRPDTIFRISSLTKPIVAAAALSLVEDGKLSLDEPVDGLLPELADRRVLRQLDGPVEDTVPAHRPITARDLLTLRLGFGFIMGPPDAYPILAEVDRLGLGMGPPSPATPPAPDEWLRRFGTLPLMHQPGERWCYELAFAVLGTLVARAAGQPLETVLRERLFDPLGMVDTGFSVPAAKLDRLATCYQDGADGELEVYDGVEDSQWSRPPAFPDGCGGLVSTVEDYLAFGQLLLNGGEKVLSPESVRAMTTDQLTAEQRAASDSVPIFLGERGWGLGVSTIPRTAGGQGGFGWDGGLGTSWRSDPEEGLVGVLMTQRLASFDSPRIDEDFWTAVYAG